LILLAAVAALIGGAVAVLTHSRDRPDAGAGAPPAVAVANEPATPAAAAPPDDTARGGPGVAAPGADAVDAAARQNEPRNPAVPAETPTVVAEAAPTAPAAATRNAVAAQGGGGPVLAAVGPRPAGRPRAAVAAQGIDPRDPTFDVVRVTRQGRAVIAGRAEPGAQVTVLDQGEDLGTVTADPRGEWVLVPAEPLAAGATQLTIVAALPGGERRESNDVVILSVPQREAVAAVEPVLAILSSRRPNRAARVLQGPLGPVLRADGGAGVVLDLVDYDERGDVVFAGRAEPNRLVRLYADNELVGTAVADAAGDWQLTVDRPISVGDHELRVDAVADNGEVVARVALPFTRAAVSLIVLRDDRVIVQPGNSLWRIARATYGQGIRFTVIYEANRTQIRDPDLIYPGQIFTIPATN
jgi:nucleoid-associated protein YgaU